jgi:hypothetical protein
MKVIAFIAHALATLAGLPAHSPDPCNINVVHSSRAGATEFLIKPAT